MDTRRLWDLFFDAEAPVTLVMPDGRILAVQYVPVQHTLHDLGMTSLVTTNDA